MNHTIRRRDHVKSLSALHGVPSVQIRRLIAGGVLPDVDMPGEPNHKQPEETTPGYAARLLLEGGPLVTQEDFAAARRKIRDALAVTTVVMPNERFAEALAHLDAKGKPRSAKALFELLGGNIAHLNARLKSITPDPIGPERRAAVAALDCRLHHLEALIRQGFVEELREGSPAFGTAIDFGSLREDVHRRYRAWLPETFDFQSVKDVAVIRSGLRMGALDHHPEGVLGGATDLLIAKGKAATPTGLEDLLGGDRQQFETYLRRRARERGDVPLPPRTMKGLPDIESLRAAVANEISELHDTPLDRRRGSSRDLPTHAQIGRVVENPHAQLQVVATVVTLHGTRIKTFAHKVVLASRALAALGEPLLGTDINNPAELAAALAAARLVTRSGGNRNEIQRLNEDINSWRFAIEIFEDYLGREDLPGELVEFLSQHRPAFPSGGDTLFQTVRQEIDNFHEHSKAIRDGELQPYLADLPGFLNRVLEGQTDFEELRDRVRARVGEAEEEGGVGQDGLVGHFETDARLPDGTVARVAYRYRVIPWPAIMVSIAKKKKRWARQHDVIDRRAKNPFDLHPGSALLFENRYAVEMLGCTRDGEPIEYPLDIIRFHRDFGFWQPRSLPDADAFDKRCASLSEFGLSNHVVGKTGYDIGNYEKGKFKRVRAMRTLYGVFLLPLEEIHHSNLIGALHVASRAMDALRVGDLMQWNVGTGLETGWDKDGKPFPILSSIPKKKVKQRKTPLNDLCERLTEKLLTVASERFFQGEEIPEMPRWHYNGKGPEFERLIFCGRKRGLSPSQINCNSRMLMCGNDRFKSHYMKYIWSALSRAAGQTVEERREAHGHTRAEMTIQYDVLTPEEEGADVSLRHEQAVLRAKWIRGKRETPLPDPPLQALRFERRRLVNDIEFLEDNDAPEELAAAKGRLVLVEAKIRRAEEAA